ncbi:MAG: hypothetical protein AAGG48_28580 [Planctomycetota bacterium]
MQQPTRHLRAVVCCVLFLIGTLAVIAFANKHALMVAHHRSRFEATQSEQLRLRPSAFGTRAEYDARVLTLQHELFHHQSRLLELHAIREIDVELSNIQWSTSERSRLLAKIDAGYCPPHLTWHAIVGSSPMEISVWCDPEHVDEWEAFLASENQRAGDAP